MAMTGIRKKNLRKKNLVFLRSSATKLKYICSLVLPMCRQVHGGACGACDDCARAQRCNDARCATSLWLGKKEKKKTTLFNDKRSRNVCDAVLSRVSFDDVVLAPALASALATTIGG